MTNTYTEIAQQIITALRDGVKPWQRPWTYATNESGIPYNLTTQTNYTGINILILWRQAIKHTYQRSAWLTFNQARRLGARIKRKERGTRCVFFRPITIKDNDTDNTKTRPMRKTFHVFNLAQLTEFDHDPKPKLPFNAIAQGEVLLHLSKAHITYGTQKAAYCPSTDKITLPNRDCFKTPEDFYATALHELIHWTGHKQRLNRVFEQQYGRAAYAFEELVAEIGSAFLCAHLGLQGELQHASYINQWLEILAQDKRALFKAASLANKACQYIQQFNQAEQAVNPVLPATFNG